LGVGEVNSEIQKVLILSEKVCDLLWGGTRPLRVGFVLAGRDFDYVLKVGRRGILPFEGESGVEWQTQPITGLQTLKVVADFGIVFEVVLVAGL